MYVILAEKDSQALDYYRSLANVKQVNEKEAKMKGYLQLRTPDYFGGQTAIITWAKGHLTELKDPGEYDEKWEKWSLDTLPIIPETFEYKTTTSSKSAIKQFKTVKYWLEKADTIVWAGDIDREGSYISYSICLLAGVWGKSDKTFKSLWIDDLAPKVIRKGFKNLQDIDYRYNQALEAQARAYSDWLLGMNGSRLLTLTLQQRLGLPKLDSQRDGKIAVGRIISPTLFFVYQREKEIDSFVPRTYYELVAQFDHENGSYIGKYIPADITYSKGERKGEKWKGDCDTKEQWEKLIQNPKFIGDTSKGLITTHEVELKESRAPRLMSLSDIQKLMDKRLGMEPVAVLDVIQELYEKDKVVTYPRTSSEHISTERYELLKDSTSQMVNFLGLSDEVLSIPENPDGFFVNNKKAAVHAALTPTEIFPTQEVFNGWSKAKQMIYTEILKRSLAMFLPKYQYEQTTIITSVGAGRFKTVGKVPKHQGWKILWNTQGKDKKEEEELIPVHKGDTVIPHLNTVEKQTVKPTPYTLGKLLEAMEYAGRHFKDDELRQIMKETQGLGTEATRAPSIDKLKNYNWITLKKGKVYLTTLGRLICQSIEGEKLLCDAQTTALWEQSLRKISTKENTQERFIGNIKRYLGENNPDNNLFVNLTKWINSTDYGSYNEWLASLRQNQSGEVGTCPKCGAPVKYLKNVAKCENGLLSKEDREKGVEPNCDFFLPLSIAGKKISSKQVESLLAKGKTSLIKGFKKKDKKSTFDAHLILNKDYSVSFEFEKQKKR
ncbi:topoisomerase I (plasmid) [Streptococcus ruminicola]|uniref:DNA topoisomerase n=1 Tax=Streptococcus ruminicola TaxID=2686210 RepID=A0A6G8I2T6_9STRE|nr:MULTISPECIES: type IA DNA topoisomerase [Streptococcus]QGX47360.1 topoisomerase I [Streptococcus equinus]QIM47409.1 topoisomerase I [Streptococcus ruminicola]